jgi:ATP-dependent DNA helicase RecQ
VKVLIVAKTRRGSGACVGGITADGGSVRLVAADAARNEHAGLEYEVGEVWEIDHAPDPNLIPPHVENILVLRARRLRRSQKLEQTVRRFMPPIAGGPDRLFDGLTQATPAGSLYIAQRGGLPSRSTMFWVPDRALTLDCEGKRIRYRYLANDGGRTLAFVGFQEPLPEIPAGTLLRVSLAHWWRPEDRPDEELRCFAQISGWFLEPEPQSQGSAPHGNNRSAVTKPAIAASVSLLPLATEKMKETFGFASFLPMQGEVIARILRRQDTLVVMPTGGGKSLCYQLPSLLFDGLTAVISPLIALMQDQVRQLHEVGVAAACLNHMVPLNAYTTVMDRVRRGKVKLLYLSPETLLRPEMLLLLEQSNLACLAVDEAHCISEWGHDFRPEYRQLQTVRSRFPGAVCVALTATATPRVRADILRLLGIAGEGEFVASFNRPNLFLSVEPRHDGLRQILRFLEAHRGESGIIYCGKRKQADDLCAELNARGWPALPYHAGLADHVRLANQTRFSQDDVPIIVATIAFGMGINKSNVRFVIHAHLPKDIESYYQEIGRAGRDGLSAHCLLLYSLGDAVLHRHFINEGADSERLGREARLQALLRFADARECRRKPLLSYFNETLTADCGHCDNCVQTPVEGETLDATADALKFLTCVQQTGQVFGQSHIIAVLRGSRSARVIERRHDRLSFYGAGKDHSAEGWGSLARQFIRLGLLDQDLEFAGLRLTPKGWEVLRNKAQVLVVAQPVPAIPAPAETVAPHDPELFDALRKLRRGLADQARVPAYFIFSDRTLLEIAARFPQDREQLLSITGVGQTKLANYGDAFIEAVRTHCARSGFAPRLVPQPAPRPAVERPARRRRFQEIGERFGAGQSIEEIARSYGIQPGTVVQHLHRFVLAGSIVDPQRVLEHSALAKSDRNRILRMFSELGFERLAPVYEALFGAVTYQELQLLRLYFLICEREKLHPE